MLIRVLEIPKSSGDFHFNGGEPQPFIEVDWFRDEHPLGDPGIHITTVEGRQLLTTFIKGKRYFDPLKAYLVLHPKRSFTINYEAD